MDTIPVRLVDGCRPLDKQEPFFLEILPQENIAQLKRAVYSFTGIEENNFQLYYKDTAMLENKMVKDYKVEAKSDIEYRRMKAPSPLPPDAPSYKILLEEITEKACSESEEKLLDKIEIKEALNLIYKGIQILDTLLPDKELFSHKKVERKPLQPENPVVLPLPPSLPSSSPSQQQQPQSDDLSVQYREQINSIKEMAGDTFTEDQIIAALVESNGNTERAVNLLFQL